MKKKIMVTKGHLAKDDREAKEIITASKKIAKLGKDLIETDTKAKRKSK